MQGQEVYIDSNRIPDCILNELVRSSYAMVLRYKSTPEGRAKLEKETEDRKRRQAQC